MPELTHLHDVIDGKIRTKFVYKCPDCKEKMDVLGVKDQVLWCYNCDQAYKIVMRRENTLDKKDVKNVLGFKQDKDDNK